MEAWPNTDITRRRLISTAASSLAAGLLSQALPVEWPRWLLAQAAAAGADLVRDTLHGFVAFIVPGDDRYSRAQGTFVGRRGGIDAGATEPVIAMLDFAVSDAQGNPVPQSGGLAALLNFAAQRMGPAAASGAFASPFARLSYDEKVAAFEYLEANPALESVTALLEVLPGVVGLIAYSEAPVVDRSSGWLRHTPVGWRISGFGGPADGRAELRGFYGGRTQASD